MLPTTTPQWIIKCENKKEGNGASGRAAYSSKASRTTFDNLELIKDVPIPPLGPHDCLIKVVAVSLNFRDVGIALGQYPSPARDQYVPTSDGAGTVVAVGDKVTLHRVGDKVCTLLIQGHLSGLFEKSMEKSFMGSNVDGPLRKYATYPETGLASAPASMTLLEASTLPCAALTAWNALFGLRDRALAPGDYVLTQGTGGVSLFAAQLALAAGARVIGTTSSENKGERLKALGVQHVVNYKSDRSWGQTARQHTNDVGVAHVVDVGGEETIVQSLKALKNEGVVSIIGFLASQEEPSHPDIFANIWNSTAIVRAIRIGSREQFVAMAEFMSHHHIKPVVDATTFEFGQAREAFDYLRQQDFMGKIVIRVSEE